MSSRGYMPKNGTLGFSKLIEGNLRGYYKERPL